MSALTLTAPPITGLQASVTAPASATERGQIRETAEKFEASFMSVMMQSMFAGVKTSQPFGGGQAEEMFKSLLTESMAKEVSKAGGVGLADTIQREMLKLQGLKD